MALSRDKKNEIVDGLSNLLQASKMTVVASYPGTGVSAMQSLRKIAQDNGTIVKVVKNRLVIKALQGLDKYKDTDVSSLKGQLLYAFNSDDEVAAAQALARFAKEQTSLKFEGAISADGQFISAEDVKTLADLPSKEALRAQLIGVFSAPLSGFVNVLGGNIRGVLTVLNARSEAIK